MSNKLLAISIVLTVSVNQSTSAIEAEKTLTLPSTIVKATRVDKDLIHVPQSMDIIYAEDIERNRYQNIADVIKSIPNVNLPEIAGDYSYIQVRGLPRNLEQTNVPVYVDGVPQTSLYGLNLSLTDVASIEFLRGTQSNVYGSNARDGMIVITTKKPSDKDRLSITAGMASYGKKSIGEKSIKVHGSTKLTNTMALKATAKHLSKDGFVQNSHHNKTVNDKTQDNLGLGLYWQPNGSLSTSIDIDYSKIDGGAYPYVPRTGNNGKKLTTAMDVDGVFEQTSKGASIKLDWQLVRLWTLSSVTGYRGIDTFGRFDADLAVTPANKSTLVDTWIDEKDTFQEIRLSNKPNQTAVDWVFGVAYHNATEDNKNSASMKTGGMELTKTTGEFNRDTYTAFVDANWHIAPTWQLGTGIRYTKEDYKIDSVFNNAFLKPPQTSGSYQKSYTDFMPKVALSKQFTNDDSLYASYAEGFLSGGASWMAEETTVQGRRLGNGKVYKPETSKVAELGYKGYWLDRSISTSLNLFQSIVNDMQYAYPDKMGNTRIATIDEVHSRGVEGSISALLGEKWQTAVRFGVNDAKVTEVDGYSGATIVEGSRIPFAPKYNIHTEASYETAIDDDWYISPSVSLGIYGDVTLDGQGKKSQSPYHIMNASLDLNYRDDYTIRIWGSNITDKRYRTYAVDWGKQEFCTYGEPLKFGVDVTAKF